ncbi:MAG TPA: YidC/Oxa1 family membrane protein insertase [Patescibacteria group bacterium]|nr:YidC/Oxa1 family membrane protein insertase [Patescibacteria group bacterium]
MYYLYDIIIYKPLLNLMVFTYNIIPGHDIGIVIILLTLAIRFILAPQMHKSLHSQKKMTALQPKLKELKEKHKGDKVAEGQATMQLYKEHGVSPWGSCLPLLIQLPFLIAIYQVFTHALNGQNIEGLYSFVHNPGTIKPMFLNIMDLSKFSWTLTILSTFAQYWQAKMMVSKDPNADPTAQAMQKQTMYILPLLTLFMAYKLNLPAGLLLYWVLTSLFQIGQQYYVLRQNDEPAANS